MTKQASTSTQPSSTKAGTGLNKTDLVAAGAKAEPKLQRTQPWVDLEPSPDGARIPRENTTMSIVLKCMNENAGRTGAEARTPGATFEEMTEALKAFDLGHHSPRQLLKWMNGNRGWGFKMDEKTGRVVALHVGQPKAGR